MNKTYITIPIVIALTLSILIGQILPNCLAYIAPVTGAIFTTDKTGLLVNGNIYQYATDVYLSGGPGPNAPPTAAGLPDGEYYFQVTDPPGKKLLSTDGIEERRFKVEGGIITQYLGTTHNWNPIPEIPGAIVIQLWPFDKTPNKGGVYKAWATPVDDYNPSDPHSFWGFIPKYSKTDNYKVRLPKPITKLILDKFYDENNNGIYDNGDYLIKGWRIDVTNPLGVTNTYYTPRVIDVTGNPGIYTATEELPAGWEQTALRVDGAYIAPTVTTTVSINSGETHDILYGNKLPSPSPARLVIKKFNDKNNNGIFDGTDVWLTKWNIDVTDPSGDLTSYSTVPIDLVITEFGKYTITEAIPAGWVQTALIINGTPQTVDPTAVVTINPGNTYEVHYGNYKPPPPPIGVSLQIIPISRPVGSSIDFKWTITSPPKATPVSVILKLTPPVGAPFNLYTGNAFPADFAKTITWTATTPKGTWRADVIYTYTYLGVTYTAGTFGTFTVT